MICWNLSKNSESFLISGSLEKFERLICALEVEILLFHGVAIASLCTRFFSGSAFSFTTSSSFYTLLLQPCLISSNEVSSSAKSKSLIPSTFSFSLTLLGGNGFRMTSSQVVM